MQKSRVGRVPLEQPLHTHPWSGGIHCCGAQLPHGLLLQNHSMCLCVCVSFSPLTAQEPGTIFAGLPPGHSKRGRWILFPFKQASHHNCQQPTCTEGEGGSHPHEKNQGSLETAKQSQETSQGFGEPRLRSYLAAKILR